MWLGDLVKLCVIGGGSTYTPELVDGLLRRRDRLPIEELHLVDVDEGRLAVLGPLAERMASAAGADWNVRWGTDRAAGIRNATFVISQMRVGGMAARERDEQLGREFGLIGQETTGVGGFAKALRTIPVALDIARDIEARAPARSCSTSRIRPGWSPRRSAAIRTSPRSACATCRWSFSQWFARGLGARRERARARLRGAEPPQLGAQPCGLPDGVDHVGTLVDGMAGHAERHPPSRRPANQGWTADIVRLIDAIPNYYLLYYLETAAWEPITEVDPPDRDRRR